MADIVNKALFALPEKLSLALAKKIENFTITILWVFAIFFALGQAKFFRITSNVNLREIR